MDVHAADVDNHHLPSSLPSFSRAAFVNNIPRIVRLSASKRDNSNLPKERIAWMQLPGLAKN